ncbi:MAG: beta-lactamase family protein, partial [Chloroflexota bacterium]|nr:beta-lactamase family protein [Chloroflexota bacterium]
HVPPATQSTTNTPPALDTPEKHRIPSARIDDRLNTLVERIPLAGLAVGIHFKGELYEQGYGLADLDSGEPVTGTTVFKIASLTKSFTAAAILRLVEEGQLSLDDPLSRYIPGTPAYAEEILVRHLLEHTSGLPEWSVDVAQEALPETFSTAEAVDYYFNSTQQLEFEPGESWQYNNIGYFLLGAIIENLTGVRYGDYFMSSFFQPLEMRSTFDCATGSGELTTGYHSRANGLETARSSDLRFLAAAGALCSNVGDLLKWLDALSSGKVIAQETWQQMITPTGLPSGEITDYGLGFVVQQADQGMLIMHEGATAGFNSYFAYYPEHDLRIVLLTNTDGFDPDLRSIASLLADMILRE